MRTSRLLAGLHAALIAAACTSLAVHAEEKVLNIYNWTDYIGKDTIAKFEKETGIKVKYDLYDSNETLQAKLLTGKAGYDIVVPSMEFAGRQILAGVHQKLNKAELSNYGNLNKSILQKVTSADPGNQYLVPYMWGTAGVAINVDKVKKALGGKLPDDAWQLLFDPDYTAKLKSCGISYLDGPSDVYAMMNLFQGREGNDFSDAAMQANNAQLAKVRKDIRMFNSAPIDPLASSDLCVAMTYNGDAYMARNRAEEAKNGVKVQYLVPKKGTIVWVDNLAIPSDAKHPDNAHKFIDFILRPDVVAEISNEIFYANPNSKATPLVDKAITTDPNIYLNDQTMAHLSPKRVLQAIDQKRINEFWNRFKVGR